MVFEPGSAMVLADCVYWDNAALPNHGQQIICKSSDVGVVNSIDDFTCRTMDGAVTLSG